MAHDMRGHLRAFAAARFAPIKDYLGHLDTSTVSVHHHHHREHHHHPTTEIGHVDGDAKKHSWSHLTNRFSRRSYSDPEAVTSLERIVLLPGWASRRYRAGSELSSRAGAPYDIEVFISGYVVKHRAVHALSRSQRAVMKLAKRFASLPKLPDLCPNDAEDNAPHENDSSTEDLLSTTILREESTEEVEGPVLVLHQSPEAIHPDLISTPISATSSNDFALSISPTSTTCDLHPGSHIKVPLTKNHHLHLHRLHSNLETRLHPFLAGVLSNRTVRVSVQPHLMTETETVSPNELELLQEPLAGDVVITDSDGAFKIRLVISWESLCPHPNGTPVAFVDPHREYDFFVTAELMPPPLPTGSLRSPTDPCPFVPPSDPTTITRERVPLTHSSVRVISDIDDTVKLSGIHCGARAVFHNVFVKDLEENLIPGMGEWYSEMWRRGVRFHYVSNGPFELLPVITDFFHLAKLPTGSVRLRSYGTRSIFNDLLSAPSDRKRDAVLEVITSFPQSRFILIGDSGEQDLELYATVARDHPEQVLCIFIRDVNTYEDGGGGIEDPTGAHSREGGKKRSPWGMTLSRGGRVSPRSTMSSQSTISPHSMSHAPSDSTDDYFSKTPTPSTSGTQIPYTDTIYAEPDSYYSPSQATLTPAMLSRLTLSEPERKRVQLQTRLWKVCAEVPMKVAIRVFRDPSECVEAFQVIDPHLARESI
ncbi:hypothetical protein F5148DRAFT_1284339 [Russula earlei]|uniref:Uncharacterized protein n=1 Tax=Russula earlei TaxID=71964 RepID=A0ACC0U8Z4_9AGAM|nr:hypothetical protein F5148DRAFT_1284339 [Russula earlei]